MIPEEQLTEIIRMADHRWGDEWTLEITSWCDGDFVIEAYHTFHRSDDTYRRVLQITPTGCTQELRRLVDTRESIVIEEEEIEL